MSEQQVNLEKVRDKLSAWTEWLGSPPGRYMLNWQQTQYDRTVSDVFGFHAVQIGLAPLPALRESRMPLRVFSNPMLESAGGEVTTQSFCEGAVLIERPEELPFETGSLDLVVLPHLLEFAEDPHQVLREVDRVLRAEGRLIISGFNPVSLWGLRQGLMRGILPDYIPRPCRMISVPRLRDWFKLLSFDLDRGRFGCYAPPSRSEQWLATSALMEKAGDRWWPICGAVYFLAAVKRVQGMRMIGPAWKRPHPATVGRPVIAPPSSGRLADPFAGSAADDWAPGSSRFRTQSRPESKHF
jgi:SAM-dependent methyltransferase